MVCVPAVVHSGLPQLSRLCLMLPVSTDCGPNLELGTELTTQQTETALIIIIIMYYYYFFF